MATTYLRIDTNGNDAEALTVQTSAGAGDADKIPSLNSAGKIDETMIPDSVGQEVFVKVTSEVLTAGMYVTIWDDAGTLKVKKADNASISTKAYGFVKASYSINDPATVYREGMNAFLSSLTVPGNLFLGTGGGVTQTKPVGGNKILQILGDPITPTSAASGIMDPRILVV